MICKDLCCYLVCHFIPDLVAFEDGLHAQTDGGDYRPFRSRIHALAYMLLHSPHPMVEV